MFLRPITSLSSVVQNGAPFVTPVSVHDTKSIIISGNRSSVPFATLNIRTILATGVCITEVKSFVTLSIINLR